MRRVVFKHYKTGERLEVIGTLMTFNSTEYSDRIIVKKSDGSLEDIIKSTIINDIEYKMECEDDQGIQV